VSSRLEGKCALITGAGGGIGSEIARRFTEEGARVAVADIRLDAAQTTAEALEGALAVEMDVTSSPSIVSGLSDVVGDFGRLDILVNNAGSAALGSVATLSEDSWDSVMNVSLRSMFLCSKAAWRHLAQAEGRIVNTASIAGLVGMEERISYCVAKAGVVMLTKCMALDGARAGIRVNCVCPGYIATPMLEIGFAGEPDPDAARQATIDTVPRGRLGTPRDIADAFVYLASDEASYISGSALVVDGGLTSGIWGG
jgi:NAD(P)-dependent dehydrogenase (short-subunit alcohol dehydrogenase family)